MTTSADLLANVATEQDLQVELVRMCIAEAGYDPQLIQPHPDPSTGYTFTVDHGAVPPRVCWRARELVGVGEPKCFACTRRDRRGTPTGTCTAGRRFVRDCRNDG